MTKKAEPWKDIILCLLTASLYCFAQDLIIWLGWTDSPRLSAIVLVLSLLLSVVGAGAIYVFFAWLGSIPADDPRQSSEIKK